MLSAKQWSIGLHFIRALVRRGRGSNPQHPAYAVNALPLNHHCLIFKTKCSRRVQKTCVLYKHSQRLISLTFAYHSLFIETHIWTENVLWPVFLSVNLWSLVLEIDELLIWHCLHLIKSILTLNEQNLLLILQLWLVINMLLNKLYIRYTIQY